MVRIFLLLTLVCALTSCSVFSRDKSRRADTERELPFRASLTKGDDKRDVAVSVVHKGEDLDAVRESVRFQATKYCLLNFGGSDAEWEIDPETADWAYIDAGDTWVFSARCSVR